ncbi:MAG: hypothetical protein BroJett040_18310 [Oligoflexia bacterium]|nr:MAG: hypothetical protein BroJett040_18310 [Oligoflexia bacterium]
MATENDFYRLQEQLKAGDAALAAGDFTNRLPGLLEVLGHPDAKFRDNLGWSTLSKYFRSAYCPAAVRSKILDLLLSNEFLFYKICDGETVDSVKRSFSILTIADILGGDLKYGALIESSRLRLVAYELCRYLDLEKDWRGHSEAIGWIHALAHSGDAFWALASHPSLEQNERVHCLTKLLSHIEKRGQNVFQWQEDYRLARALSVLLERIPEDFARNLIEQKYESSLLFRMPAIQNILTTFRCVYLEMHWSGSKRIDLMESLKKIIY